MLVSGELSVDAAGAVSGYTLDQPEKLPPTVKELLATALPTFKFVPVEHDGMPQATRAKMSLQVVAHRVDPEHIALRLRSARFDEASQVADPTAIASLARRPHMRYPEAALNAGVTGTVYLLLRFDRSGQVTDAAVSQVNLRVDEPPMQMNRWRTMFARSALEGARGIVLHPPTSGPHAGDASFTGVLPVVYLTDGMRPVRYGEWDAYVRGPVQDIAWMHGSEATTDNNEAVPAGEFAMTGSDLRPRAPPGG